jgi:energy-coupling factor transporter ATP-binding protein EcfA2
MVAFLLEPSTSGLSKAGRMKEAQTAQRITSINPTPAPYKGTADSVSSAEIARTIVEVDQVDFCYRNSKALQGITLKIPKQKVTAFIGPSGCGKSTLLRPFASFGMKAKRILPRKTSGRRARRRSGMSQKEERDAIDAALKRLIGDDDSSRKVYSARASRHERQQNILALILRFFAFRPLVTNLPCSKPVALAKSKATLSTLLGRHMIFWSIFEHLVAQALREFQSIPLVKRSGSIGRLLSLIAPPHGDIYVKRS